MIKRVYIEITNVCNLSCGFCRKTGRPSRFLTVEEFSHILEQVKPVTGYIYLHVQGEPLLHPHLDDIFSLCDQHHMHVQLVTNGTFLHKYPKLYEHPSLRKISFSLQSVEYQNPADTDEYMHTILQFCKNASEKSETICEMRFWREDQVNLPVTAKCLAMIRSSFCLKRTNRKNNWKIMDRVYLDTANSFQWPDISNPASNTRGRCLGGLTQIAILSDGTVTPCCLDADGDIPLGNIFHTSLIEILHSERYMNLTRGFQENRLVEPLCQKCTYRMRFQ
ncbi:MAG: SPASM domain-containing protein [Solobacterium sp.]|nr:SPASM domain-containing protein [Solobacterium sp.]